MHETIYYIYVITNMINSKVYVGQTKVPKSRRWQHWSAGKKQNSKKHLYRSMFEYDVKNFSFSIIEQCSITDVDERERYWISYYGSCDPEKGYNKETGGSAGKSILLTDEDRNRIYKNPDRSKKISDSLKGRRLSDEHRRATSEGVSRYFATHEVKHTEESKRNMSAAQKIIGARKSENMRVDSSHPDAQPKTCPHCNETFFPKKFSPWGIKRHVKQKFCSRKCIMLNNNKNISDETRQKISNTKRGQKMSIEQKMKISNSMKRYREEQRKKEGEA